MPKQSYQPVPFVDAAHLTREEWLEYRKHAVCASDLPVIMELSGYKSVLRLFQEKVSRRPKEELDSMVAERMERDITEGPPRPLMFGTRDLIIDPNADFNLPAECGHALEPVIGRYFAIKLGVPIHKDTVMYAHPDYPFLMVDNDFIAITPDPETGELCRRTIIECKNITNWKRDQVLDGPLYEHKIQTSIAMHIMNAADAYILYLHDNNESGFIDHYLPRDYAFEASLVSIGKNFWLDHVEKEILPMPMVPSDIAQKEMAEYGYSGKPYRPRVQLYEPGLPELVSQYTALQEELEERKEALEDTEQRIASVKMKMAPHMLGQREAECGDIRFRWKTRPSRSCNYDGFKKAYPAIYAKYVKESNKPVFDVTVKKKSNSEKEAA